MARTHPQVISQRMELVEKLLVRCHTIPDIVARVRANKKIRDHNGEPFSSSTIKRDVKRVRDRWAEESSETDREGKREEATAILRETMRMAFERIEVVRDAAGNPVIRDDGNPVVLPRPDYRAIIRGVSVMGDIQGLKVWRIEDETRRTMQEMFDEMEQHMSPEAYEELIRALEIVEGRPGMAGPEGPGSGPASVH